MSGPRSGSRDRVREARPRRVEDGGARSVDPAVEVGVEPAATRGDPRVDEPRGRVRPRGRRRARCASTSRTSGQTSVARRSCVAALFIAAVTLASVCFRFFATSVVSSSTRCTEPYAKFESPAPDVRRGTVVPVHDRAGRRVDRPARGPRTGGIRASRTRRSRRSAAPGRPRARAAEAARSRRTRCRDRRRRTS